jgi:hypothetical protein
MRVIALIATGQDDALRSENGDDLVEELVSLRGEFQEAVHDRVIYERGLHRAVMEAFVMLENAGQIEAGPGFVMSVASRMTEGTFVDIWKPFLVAAISILKRNDGTIDQGEAWGIVGRLASAIPDDVVASDLVELTFGIFGAAEMDKFYGTSGTFVAEHGHELRSGRWPVPALMFQAPGATASTIRALFPVGDFRQELLSDGFGSTMNAVEDSVAIAMLRAVHHSALDFPSLAAAAYAFQSALINHRGGRAYVQNLLFRDDEPNFQLLFHLDVTLSLADPDYVGGASSLITVEAGLMRLRNGVAGTKALLADGIVKLALVERDALCQAIMIKSVASKCGFDHQALGDFLSLCNSDRLMEFIDLAINTTDGKTCDCYFALRGATSSEGVEWGPPPSYAEWDGIATIDTVDVDFSQGVDAADCLELM